MANHRATDGPGRRSSVLGSSDRTHHGSLPSQPARTVAAPRPPIAPPAPEPAPEPVTAAVLPAAARRSSPDELRATSTRRSTADDIAARATTTLIPNSPGDRAKAGPIFVDGSGRRARRFKGLAVAAATLAAGYVGVVVTGALAGPTGPVGGGPAPIADSASIAPPAPAVPAPVVPSPIAASPADVTRTTKAPAKKPTTTTRKAAPRTTPRTPAPAPVVPAPAPVVPAQPVPEPEVVAPAGPEQPEQVTPGEPADANPAARNA